VLLTSNDPLVSFDAAVFVTEDCDQPQSFTAPCFQNEGTQLAVSIETIQNASSVPEPTTTALLALGLLGVGAVARRRSN
jgi:hypothetical protein